MADTARSTEPPPPEAVTRLSGSSPPGGASPTFEPVAAARPAPAVEIPAARPALSWLDDVGDVSYNPETHPERDLVKACGEAQALAREHGLAWQAVSDDDVVDLDNPAVQTATRLGHELEARTAVLACVPAHTPEGLSCKASVMQEIMAQDSVSRDGDLSDHVAFVTSIFDDAGWIGSRSRFTIAQLVGLEENPPVEAPGEGWAFRHKMQQWAQASLECDYAFDHAVQIDTLVQRAGIPPQLFVQETDAQHFNKVKALPEIGEQKWYGHPKTIAALRGKLDGSTAAPKEVKDPAGREARIARILAAYDAWPGALHSEAAAKLYDEADEHGNRADALRTEILGMEVSSLDGLMMKAQIMAVTYANNWQALAYEEKLLAEVHASDRRVKDVVFRDLLRLLIVSRVSVRALAGERPEPARQIDRRALYAYAQWLRIEARLLGRQIFPEQGEYAERGAPEGTAAGEFHFPADQDHRLIEQPADRAERMCALLGINWRADEPTAEPTADRSAA